VPPIAVRNSVCTYELLVRDLMGIIKLIAEQANSLFFMSLKKEI
jgi:hypothetical protein